MSVRPRRRVRSAADVLRLIIAAGLLAVGLAIETWARNTVLGIEEDVVAAFARLPKRLEEGLTGIAWIVAGALPLVALGLLLMRRRFRPAAALVLGAIVAGFAMVALDGVLNDRSVIAAVEDELGHPIELNASGFATSPLLAAVVAMAVIASSWLSQGWRKPLWAAVAVLTLLRVLSSGEPPLDVVIAFAVGLAVGSLALVLFGSPSFDPDGPELVTLLRRFVDPVRIEQTKNNSPLRYRIWLQDGDELELRLRTSHDRSADMLDRLWRYIRLRSSETDAPFSTLPRRLEHEALALTMAAKAGTRVRDVRAIVASGTGSVGLLVEYVEGTSLAGVPPDQIGQGLLVDMWQQVGALHRQRIAHRALGLAQVTVAATTAPETEAGDAVDAPAGGLPTVPPGSDTEDEAAAGPAVGPAPVPAGSDTDQAASTPAAGTTAAELVYEVAGAPAAGSTPADLEVHGTEPVALSTNTVLGGFDQARLAALDRDLALDIAQLLVDSALRVGAVPAVEAAVGAMGADTVVGAMPFLQPLALPSRTRRTLRANKAVLDELRNAVEEATGTTPAPLERLDRIRPRTAVSIAALAIAFYVLLPQLARAEDTAEAAASADWRWLVPILLGSAATYLFAAVAFMASAPGPVPFWPALRLQVASKFVSQIAPAQTGNLAAGVRFLQRAGFEPGAATAAAGLNALSAIVVHLSLTVAFIAWTGTSGVGGFSLPQANTILVVLAVVASAGGLVIGFVPAVRRRIARPLVGHARVAASTLASTLSNPGRVLALLGGSTGITLTYLLTFGAAVQAFGGGLSLPQVGAAYLVASMLASTAPTPGGLGAVELALSGALSGYGMSDAHAISAVLTFRLATFWLPMLPGWFVFHQMQRRAEL